MHKSGAPIELKYTVVHYDQRGFGKTYIHGKRGKKKIKIEQYVEDAEGITSFVRNYLHKDKVILLCESWGTVIGLNLIQRHPEWYYAYFGLGQVNNTREFLKESYAFALNAAQNDKNCEAIKDLKKYPPATSTNDHLIFKSFLTTGTWLDYYNGKKWGYNADSGAAFFFSSLWNAPEYHCYDFINTLSGYMSTTKKLVPELMDVDLQHTITSVNIPVYFISGEWDYLLPYTKRYFTILDAPRKEFFIVKNAGHQVRGDQPDIVEGFIFQKINEILSLRRN